MVDLAAFAAALAEAVEARLDDYVARIGDVYDEVVPRAEGTLADALRLDLTPQGGGSFSFLLHGEVDDALAPYGKWIDQPVAEIVPVNAKVLHWFGSGGEDVFAHRVIPSREHEGWWQSFVERITSDVIGL